jgi:hypothetical protein
LVEAQVGIWQAIHHGIASKDNFKQITAIHPKIMLLLTLQVRSDLKPYSSRILFLLHCPIHRRKTYCDICGDRKFMKKRNSQLNYLSNKNHLPLKLELVAGLSTGHGNENRTIEQMNHHNGV